MGKLEQRIKYFLKATHLGRCRFRDAINNNCSLLQFQVEKQTGRSEKDHVLCNHY